MWYIKIVVVFYNEVKIIIAMRENLLTRGGIVYILHNFQKGHRYTKKVTQSFLCSNLLINGQALIISGKKKNSIFYSIVQGSARKMK